MQFTFHLNCKYHPWGLINDMQISIYSRKDWHALSHSLHFFRLEGRLPTIGGTRLTRSMAVNELGFLYTRCGTCSSSYGDVFRMASAMVISTGPPTCAQDDGGNPSQGFVFLLFQSPCLVDFRFFRFTGMTKFSFTKFPFAFCSPPVTVKVLILFVPVNSIWVGSIASLCSNYVRSAQSKIVQPLGFCLGHCNQMFSLLVIFTFWRLWGSKHAVFSFYLKGSKPVSRQSGSLFCLCCSKLVVFESRLCGGKLVVLLPVWL